VRVGVGDDTGHGHLAGTLTDRVLRLAQGEDAKHDHTVCNTTNIIVIRVVIDKMK
jgi:hypothetical protein